MCERCPHKYEVRTKSCDVREDQDLWALGNPHQCTWDEDFLCRGCVEKMKMNGIQWECIQPVNDPSKKQTKFILEEIK